MGDDRTIEFYDSGEMGKQNLTNEICHSPVRPVCQPKCNFISILRGDDNGKDDK